jgi:hypothetical protein
LENHGSEVVNMLMDEWKPEEAPAEALKLPLETVIQYRGSV